MISALLQTALFPLKPALTYLMSDIPSFRKTGVNYSEWHHYQNHQQLHTLWSSYIADLEREKNYRLRNSLFSATTRFTMHSENPVASAVFLHNLNLYFMLCFSKLLYTLQIMVFKLLHTLFPLGIVNCKRSH